LARVPKAKLLLVSRTPAESYMKIAGKLGVGDRVLFSPATSHIERFYAACDAFVFPTPYDAFGMVIAEPMASGLPVITSKEACAGALISNGVHGILLDNPGDPAELAGDMMQSAEDPEICRKFGEAARCVAERHGWDSVASATMEVYEAVLAGRRK